jgi:hypothetical protein
VALLLWQSVLVQAPEAWAAPAGDRHTLKHYCTNHVNLGGSSVRPRDPVTMFCYQTKALTPPLNSFGHGYHTDGTQASVPQLIVTRCKGGGGFVRCSAAFSRCVRSSAGH